MAIGESSVADGLKGAASQALKHPFQFTLAIILVMFCGATKKFQTYPMPYIAGQSKCQKVVKKVAFPPGATTNDGKTYTVLSWMETTADCKEKAKVFLFTTESFTITTSYLVFFGLTKAIFNFITGVCCDRYGRKWTLVAGWFLGLPMPILVIFAGSWWTAAVSNIFLGMQQALVWSATIFIMVDYLGQKNSGIAIGLNETIGYTTIAIVTQISAAILDEDEPRTTNYYVVLALIALGIFIGLFLLADSKSVAVNEEAADTSRTEEEVQKATITGTASLQWPSGRTNDISVAKSAFIYTSFVNASLMSICFAGLMINFISGFAWGLFVKWMKSDYIVDDELLWSKLDKGVIANIVLCYGLPKGLLQVFFGFLGDRFGRKWLIVGGLTVCALALFCIGMTGDLSDDPTTGFYIGALLLGTGTGIMYTNNLAAVCDHSDPSWRASALGSYRFWRDLGYAVGALVTGLFADAIGTGGSVFMTSILTALAATIVAVAYTEAKPNQSVDVNV